MSNPSELPEGWAWATLDDIADSTLGKMLDRKKGGDYLVPYLRNINVQWGRIDAEDVLTMSIPPERQEFFRVQRGDLLVCEGGEVGRCAVFEGDDGRYLAFQKALHRVRPLGGVSSSYLRYYLEYLSVTGGFGRFTTGSTIKHLPQQQLKRLPVRVPPLDEQRCIIAALEEQLSRLDAAVEAVEQSRTRSRQLWSSILHQMTEGTLSRNVRRPVTWERTDEVAAVQGGIQKQARRRPVENKFPFLRVANVPRGRLALEEVHEIELFKGELERYRLESGDLLVVEGNGSPDQIGRAASWRGTIENCVHQNHLIRVRPGPRLRPEFLELAWNSPKVAQQLKKVASSTSGLHTLSTAKVKSVAIPVPSLEDQDALLEAVQQWRTKQLAAEAAQQAALVRAAGLRRSLLAEAFAGRLVPQDPADEPAEALLTRIRAERETVGAAQPRRRSPRRAPAQRKRASDTAPASDAPPPPRADASALATATQPTLDLEMPS
ncbi:restriction endonuclease subunit S [Streptomyces sp. NPDC029041]|uniref:restriction endonuclease subunit S n=1 Tax=Streptomyces sp. NPDC029041 TaxID=3155727 RepID=UPI0033C65CC1